MHRYIGYDARGVKRIWGEGPTLEDARLSCQEAAADYVRSRPDTGPLTAWKLYSVPIKHHVEK